MKLNRSKDESNEIAKSKIADPTLVEINDDETKNEGEHKKEESKKEKSKKAELTTVESKKETIDSSIVPNKGVNIITSNGAMQRLGKMPIGPTLTPSNRHRHNPRALIRSSAGPASPSAISNNIVAKPPCGCKSVPNT
jgi:hypothetical protein